MKTTLLTLAFSLAATAALAAPQVTVAKGWSRPAAAGGMGAGYMVLTNRGTSPDSLLSVSSPLAASASVHQSSVAGGVASMKMLDRAAIPPGASLTFAPGGAHLMLMGLKKALNVGDTVPVTLTFASGARLTANLAVRVTPP